MKPWERRLKDLSLLLYACHRNYFEPELLRLNLNQFLQTSRTVTFILQKNKDTFSDFGWYQNEMTKWGNDKILTWAKDSRNTIEKIGDLELYSEIRVGLITSYLESQDRRIIIDDRIMVRLAIEKLLRLIKGELAYIADDEWAIKVERIWIANTLPKEELLWAMNYIYSRQYLICKQACQLLGVQVEGTIPVPIDMNSMSRDSRRVRYIDSESRGFKELNSIRVNRDPSFPHDLEFVGPQRERFASISSFESALEAISTNAGELFLRDSYHIPMLSSFDSNMSIIDYMVVHFKRRIDKFVFWRQITERVSIQPTYCFFFVSEAWVKDLPADMTKRYSVSALPTKGEVLQVVGITNEGHFLVPISEAISKKRTNT